MVLNLHSSNLLTHPQEDYDIRGGGNFYSHSYNVFSVHVLNSEDNIKLPPKIHPNPKSRIRPSTCIIYFDRNLSQRGACRQNPKQPCKLDTERLAVCHGELHGTSASLLSLISLQRHRVLEGDPHKGWILPCSREPQSPLSSRNTGQWRGDRAWLWVAWVFTLYLCCIDCQHAYCTTTYTHAKATAFSHEKTTKCKEPPTSTQVKKQVSSSQNKPGDQVFCSTAP